MQNYNLKNLTGNKIAIDCNSWEMSKDIFKILSLIYPEDTSVIINNWVSTTPFIVLMSDSVYCHTHYWVKEKGLTIISGEDFIRDNSLVAEAVSSPGTSGDGTVRQQDYSCKCGVGDGSGNLFVYGNHDSIRMCQRKLLELESLRLTSTPSDGLLFAQWLDRHRNANTVVWNSINLWKGQDAFEEVYKLFVEDHEGNKPL